MLLNTSQQECVFLRKAIYQDKRQNNFNHGYLKIKEVILVHLLNEHSSWSINRRLFRIN